MKNVWETLGISPTDNKRAIKKAYAAKLAQFHPEDHPQEFEQIQAAYTSIMNSLNRDYHEQTIVRPDLKDAFKKKDTFYQEDIKTIKKQKKTLQFENEEIHKEGTSKKESERSLYDELNLDLSFQKMDEEKAKKTTPKTDFQYDVPLHKQKQKETKHDFAYDEPNFQQKTNKQLNNEEASRKFLSDLYYEKFLERINYRKTLDIFEALILNDTFFKQMEDPYFYKKISDKVTSLVPSLNSVILSFLYDSFEIIREHYHYPKHVNDVPSAIRNYRNHKVSSEKRSRLFKTITTPILITTLIFTYLSITSNNAKQKEEKQEQIQEIRRDVDAIQRKEKSEAGISLNKAIEETYQLPYKCSVEFLFTGYGKKYPYYCQYEGNHYMGDVEYDDDGNITYISQPTFTRSDNEEEASE